MNEQKGNGVGGQLLIALALALVAGILLAVYLIGSETLRTMGLILIGGITTALVIGASALPIRAWRRKDFTGEHRITDGTRTVIKETRVLDGRAPAQTDVKLLQLPAQPQGTLYPELLQAAYRAGATALPGRTTQPVALSDYEESDLAGLDLSGPDGGPVGWDGDIRA